MHFGCNAASLFAGLVEVALRERAFLGFSLGKQAGRFGQLRGLRSQVGKQRQLNAGEKAQIEPAEDVIHEALGVADLLVAGPAGWLETGVGKLLAENLQGYAVLQGNRDGGGEGVHQPGDGGTLLGHLDEDFARLPGGVESDRDVALVTGNGKLVSNRSAFIGQAMANSARRSAEVLRVGAGVLGSALRS